MVGVVNVAPIEGYEIPVMKVPFDSAAGLIVVPAIIVGPDGSAPQPLVLDTGANITAIDGRWLESVGYRREDAIDEVEVVTAGGKQLLPVILLEQLTALGVRRSQLPVIWHHVPDDARCAGFLGLDCLANCRCIIDMIDGFVEIE